jgi:hypothetical protein
MRRDVRILLVGDGLFFSFVYPLQHDSMRLFSNSTEGVGKSTIVTSLIKEEFVSHVRPISESHRAHCFSY